MSMAVQGTLVEFSKPEALLEAVRGVQAAGLTRFETFAPCAVEGLDELLLPRPSPMPAIMLGAGACGAAGGFFMQWYATRDFPLNSGGRPLFSWPAYVPVTFELGVLTAVIVGILAFLWRAGLPRYDHPAFAGAMFARASCDRFFLWVQAEDPLYAAATTRVLLLTLNAESIEEVSGDATARRNHEGPSSQRP
jgi:hypothetical protein